MSNSTSKAFHSSIKDESKPSVTDYLEEICKEDNINFDEYISNHNNFEFTEIKDEYFINPLDESFFMVKPKYGFKDRIKSVWISLKNVKHSGYDPLDFRTLPVFMSHDLVATRLSTPWDRFKTFIKDQWQEIKWSWNFTP